MSMHMFKFSMKHMRSLGILCLAHAGRAGLSRLLILIQKGGTEFSNIHSNAMSQLGWDSHTNSNTNVRSVSSWILPAAHDCLYQIPNSGTGTQFWERICCPCSPGTYPEQYASESPVFCDCRPSTPLFIQEWSALHIVSTLFMALYWCNDILNLVRINTRHSSKSFF